MYIPESIPESDTTQMADRAGYGGTVELTGNVAVLIVDMTCEFVYSEYDKGHEETGIPAANAIAELMETATELGIPGFYSRSLTGSHPAEKGRWGDTVPDDAPVKDRDSERTQICDELAPTDEDVVFDKYKPSIFFGTQLESMLNYEDIDSLIITGMTTSGCVRATVVDAFSYNYNVKIPQECVADRSQISHEITLFDMDMKYADVQPLAEIIAELKSA